ncbi:hypothetical protein H4R21_006141, partial [Coemansia helicoidea]
FVDHPRYTDVLVKVADTLLDIYGDLMHQSGRLAELLVRLRAKVRLELRVQQDLTMLLGSMDMLLAACRIGHAQTPAATAAAADSDPAPLAKQN